MFKFMLWWLVCAVLMLVVSLFAMGITVLSDMIRELPEVWRAILLFGISSFTLAVFARALWGTRR